MTQTRSLLVFADDWGRHPSSCQHLIQELLARHQVSWINTIGTRPPKLSLETVKRGLGKLGQWSATGQDRSSLPGNLEVSNPKMWPSFSSDWSRRLNRFLLRQQLMPLLAKLPERPIAITTIPIVADLMKVLPVHSWVYYCVDDFSVWPGLDGKTLGHLEREMLPQANIIIAAGEHLQGRLESLGYKSHLLTHGVDIDFWQKPAATTRLDLLDSLQHPLVVFWGVLDQRMDLTFLRLLSERLDQENLGTIVLAGPENEPHSEVKRLKRVVCTGALPLSVLPKLAQEAAVLVMPYADLPVTQAMQPLKLKEYLATGKPAVVRDLPANRVWKDCLDIADSPQLFVDLVIDRIKSGIPFEQTQARQRLMEESWKKKADDFASLIFQDMD